jgi:hypothetical protein
VGELAPAESIDENETIVRLMLQSINLFIDYGWLELRKGRIGPSFVVVVVARA